jgi:hypothetical protein
MKALFDFGQQRTAGRAALFYGGHLLIAVLSAALVGIVVGGHAHAHGHSAHSAARSAGQLVGVLYSIGVCASVIMQRNLSYRYYPLIAVVLPVAYLAGAIGGLVIPAFLTTRRGLAEAALPSAYRSPAAITRRPGEPFGRRSVASR